MDGDVGLNVSPEIKLIRVIVQELEDLAMVWEVAYVIGHGVI